MLSDEEKKQGSGSGATWKTYSRSASWSECLPRKCNNNTKPQWNSKARACLPPLSVVKPSAGEWPKPNADDLCIWPHPPTPGARRGSAASDQSAIGFQARREELAYYEKDCSRILDHIYLGSKVFAKNREALRQNGITHVLNCVGYACPEYFKDELVYKTLWLQDCLYEDITSIFYNVFDYFEEVREHGGRVFVHCSYGISRSTSLVIAYVMWKENLSYDDAFERVRSARRVTDPNVGFIAQLLQYQKRVHALPLSPTSSTLVMYRLAPHSPYDPLHLVLKILNEPGLHKLDSRGAFIIRVPSSVYVWVGKHCSPMMSDNAMSSALQVCRYEQAKGSVVTVKEGEETSEFWDALSLGKSLPDKFHEVSEEEKRVSSGSDQVLTNNPSNALRKLDEYNSDFEIFERAHNGGVIPVLPLSEGGHETCVPVKENEWNKLRRKFTKGDPKDCITSSKLCLSSSLQIPEGPDAVNYCEEPKNFVPSDERSIPSNGVCDLSDTHGSHLSISPRNKAKEAGCLDLISDSLSLPSLSPSLSLVESFSSLKVSKPNCSNMTSPPISP